MANVSLQGSIRTCKVDTGWASKMESDRFLNPNVMQCPVWNSRDTAGRRVAFDTFYTKREGCNSASDRIVVENHLRPQYAEYVNLNANGIQGSFYGGNNMIQLDTQLAAADLMNKNNITGQFGLVTGFRQTNYPSCNTYPYVDAQAQMSEQQRAAQNLNEGFKAYNSKQRSGF